MVLSSINKIIMSQSIKNQKIKDLTYLISIYLFIFSSFIFNILYTWKRIQMKILLYFIFLTLLIRNECNIVIIGYFNIKTIELLILFPSFTFLNLIFILNKYLFFIFF